MSLDPLNFQAPSLVLPVAAYQTNFWTNLANADHPYPSSMSSPHATFNFMDRNSDALVVYDAKDNSNVAQCVMIASDKASAATSNATFLLSQNQVPSEYQLFGVSETGFPSSFDLFKNNPLPSGTDRVQNVSKVTLNQAPTQRQQHYHHRHHAQAHQAQVISQKNKTRFSATGLSSNYTIVRDSKMSLSSAPSSPTAGSVGGSLSHALTGIQTTPVSLPSNPYTVQCKDSSSYSSSYSSKNFKMSASSSLSSYSSCSSLSSTPSMNGISPRKRRADDTTNNNKQVLCRKEYFRRNEREIINLCSCETCATDDVTARVDDVTLRDMISSEQEQRQKRSKNDDDVVFVSAEPPGANYRVSNYESQTLKERHLRKSRKSNKKVSPRNSHTAQAIPAVPSSDSKPFIVPSSLTVPPRLENHQGSGRYFLRSTAKGRNQTKANVALASSGEDANGVPPSTCNYIQQTMVSTVVQGSARMIDLNNNGNGRTYQPTTTSPCQTAEMSCHVVEAEKTPPSPRYHTRSRQKKAKANAQAPTGPVSSQSMQANYLTAVPYYPASVIQSVNSSTPCSPYVTTTSSQTTPALETVRESVTHTPSSSFKKIYDIHGIIGVGGGGTVYAGTRKSDGMQVAIKQVPKAKVKRWGKLNDRVVPIEFELLHRASHSSHKGIISMLDWYERRTTYILVMERPQPVIDLFDYLNQHGALSEAVARSIFRQIAEAVIHCHANGVVHRDIKDENILLNLHTSEAKLIDFGCGTVLKDAPYTEFAGTPEFYPPEWFTHRRYYGRRVDAWSMGVLLYTMVEAEVPFQKENDIVECKLRHKRAARLSDSCLHLIRWMLQKDQNMRPTIEQALTHPWFQQQSSVETTAPPSSFASVSRGVMDTDELYEKHLRLHQNGHSIQPPVAIGSSSVIGNKQQRLTHQVACTDSPQSPPRKHEQSIIDCNQRQGANYHAQQQPPNGRGY